MTLLSVNLNKIAVLRNSRGGHEPDICHAAQTCIESGCGGITVHPRPDQRHVRPDDVRALAQQYRIDPATGHFPEMDEIEQMRAEGRLTEEDQAMLDAATEVETEAKGYGEALKAFARCAL